MASILMTCVGSMGDLLPYARLASRLRERGHRVSFAVEQQFADWLNAKGFASHVLAGDLVTTLLDLSPQVLGTTDAARTMQLVLDAYLLPTLSGRVADLRVACQEADLLISSPIQIASPFVADLTHIPWVSVALTPGTIPDPGFAPTPYAWPRSPLVRSILNRLAWTYGRRTMRAIADVPINRTRAEFGLPARRDVLFAGGISHQFTAIAVSPAILPEDLGWPAFVRATGFCFWEEVAWDEPPDLTTFLAKETPVIAVSLGSASLATGKLMAPLYETSITAIHRVGARALVFGAPSEVLPMLSGDDYALAYAPHARIFPHCAAIIHHGGIGTAAQAWRAGVPALVVPWGLDQYVTAALSLERGVGQWLRRDHYTAAGAAHQLRTLLEDATLRQRARDLSIRIQQEDGAVQLAEAIEHRLL